MKCERFERKPDPRLFALHDAQRVLARAYGYAELAQAQSIRRRSQCPGAWPKP